MSAAFRLALSRSTKQPPAVLSQLLIGGGRCQCWQHATQVSAELTLSSASCVRNVSTAAYSEISAVGDGEAAQTLRSFCLVSFYQSPRDRLGGVDSKLSCAGHSTAVNTGAETYIMQTASCGQAMQYFLGSLVGSSQNALAEAAQEAKVCACPQGVAGASGTNCCNPVCLRASPDGSWVAHR